jgi:hypothetical protein
VVKLRVVVAEGLAVAADAVLVHDLARRRSLEAGSKRQRKGGEKRSNVRNSVWQFGTGTRTSIIRGLIGHFQITDPGRF